jgi:hypothetical protein
MVDTVKKVQYIAGPVKHKTGWVKMKAAKSAYKKRYLIMTHSGLRYYDKEPVSCCQ